MERRQRTPEPAETDLDYYARPENYRGSSLGSLTRFLAAKSREEEITEIKVNNTQKESSDHDYLSRRYRHILTYDMSSACTSDEVKDQNVLGETSTRYITELITATPQAPLASHTTRVPDGGSDHFHFRHDTDDLSVSRDSSNKWPDGIRSESGYGSRVPSHVERQQEHARKFTLSDPCRDCHAHTEGDAVDPKLGQTRPTSSEIWMTSSACSSRSPSIITVAISSTSSARTTRSGSSRRKSATKVVRRVKLLHRFRRVAVAVVNVLKLAKAIIKRTDSPSALLKTFTTMSREPDKEDLSENMKSYGLQFDPSYFRANKEISISSEVKTILRLPPSHRSTEQIQTAMFGLQSLPSFAEYPLHMQEKLAKVAWHEIVTPMRTIIKQGHFAENFYFILAGQAVVTIAKPGETSTQTAAIMRKGTSFGELALLHHSRRTATVTSHDTVQLLSVGRQDFFDIFMSSHGREQIPDHIKFISQMDFMKDWPLERLLERPDQCLLHFFKRNTVIVKNSKISEWLYVVKSGSCQVLKQLRGVSGNLGLTRGHLLTSRGKVDRHLAGARQSELRPVGRRALWRTIGSGASVKGNMHSPVVVGRIHVPMSVLSHEQTGTPRAANQSGVPAPLREMKPQLPVFVQIELLKPKDVFGLDLVNFNNSPDPNPPSVSLVSRGAECIMLSKSLFVKHASEQVRKRFSETVRPYPDEETMQDSLQTKVNWELYKRSLNLKVMAHKYSGIHRRPQTTDL